MTARVSISRHGCVRLAYGSDRLALTILGVITLTYAKNLAEGNGFVFNHAQMDKGRRATERLRPLSCFHTLYS